MNEEDFTTLVNLLPQYQSYLATHPDSLLSKVYGLFTVTTKLN
jgi:hypothetical protein